MNSLLMSDDQYQALAEKLEATARNVPKIMRVLWSVLVGAAVIGAWVALVDFRQKKTEDEIITIKSSAMASDERLRTIETSSAANAAKLDAIKETVSRIDRKIDMP